MSAATVEERLGNDPTSELWGEHRSRYRFASRLAVGRRVLDIACGSGFGLQMLCDAGACAMGMDYDAGALADILQRQLKARLTCADAARLPLPNASVDLVVSFETIEHVPDARAMLKELRRVLSPGGKLVLSTPNREFGPLQRHTANRFHIREFTAVELRALLLEDFSEVQLYGQWPATSYQYVPFLMLEPHYEPSALIWRVLVRLPYSVKNRLALTLTRRPFYPGETDYRFEPDATDGAHALMAVAVAA